MPQQAKLPPRPPSDAHSLPLQKGTADKSKPLCARRKLKNKKARPRRAARPPESPPSGHSMARLRSLPQFGRLATSQDARKSLDRPCNGLLPATQTRPLPFLRPRPGSYKPPLKGVSILCMLALARAEGFTRNQFPPPNKTDLQRIRRKPVLLYKVQGSPYWWVISS